MEVPDGIRALGPDAVRRVEELVEEARRQQLRELGQALEDSMRVIPRPLRGAVRKVLGV